MCNAEGYSSSEVKNGGTSEVELTERAADGGGESEKQSIILETRRYLHERVEKKEEQILKIEASVFQVANYYFVFQGVIFAAIVKGSSSSFLKCQHFWLPFSMSAIGGVLNLGTLITVAIKYKLALNELDRRRIAQYNYLYPGGDVQHEQTNKAWRQFLLVLSMLLFVVFMLLNIAAARIIPCS